MLPVMQEPKIIIGKQYVETVIPLIAAAKSSIEIIIFQMWLRPGQPQHPVSRLVQALQDATQRGVRVRCLVSSPLLAAQLRPTGIRTRVLTTGKLMHAKMMLIDDYIAIVGSHNYTKSAFEKNLEISLVVYLTIARKELRDYFNNLWGL